MLTLLNLLSAIALLVWGTHIVRTGILRVYGSQLRRILSHSVAKRPQAFAAGIGVTALVQSSNATAMLVTSFVAQGLMALPPALAIMLGADVGTALMARVLTLDLSWLSPLLIFAGVVLFLSRKQRRAGQVGRVAIGLGLLLLALADYVLYLIVSSAVYSVVFTPGELGVVMALIVYLDRQRRAAPVAPMTPPSGFSRGAEAHSVSRHALRIGGRGARHVTLGRPPRAG